MPRDCANVCCALENSERGGRKKEVGKEGERKEMGRKRKEGGGEGKEERVGGREKRGERDRKESDFKLLWSKQVIVQLATDDKPELTGKP